MFYPGSVPVSDRLTRRPSEPRHLVDPDELAELAELAEEVVLLRSAIRRLAADSGLPAPMLKSLAELRHQVLALGVILPTQRVLATSPPEAMDPPAASNFAHVDQFAWGDVSSPTADDR